LLVKDKEVIPIDRFLALVAEKLPQHSGSRPDVVDKKAAVGEFLASLRD
jgi:hypothetical protein